MSASPQRSQTPQYERRWRVLLVGLALLALSGSLVKAVYEYIGHANTDQPHTSLLPNQWPDQSRLVAPSGRPNRVVLIVIDGLRADVDLPVFKKLVSLGTGGVAHVPPHSLSRSSYATMGASAPPSRTGIRTNRYTKPFGVDTVFARAKEKGMHVVGGANLDWMEQSFGDSFARWYFEYHWDDPSQVDAAMAGALGEDADIAVLHFVEVDRAGQANQGGYLEAAEALSRRLTALLAQIDLRKDVVIITSDHSHAHHTRGYGDAEPAVTTVPYAMAGRGILRQGGAAWRPASIGAVGTTISALLGIQWANDMVEPPLWDHLDPAILGAPYLALRKEGWLHHRVAYERIWLQDVYDRWTSTNWRGKVVGNDVSTAATVPADAPLDTLMRARAETLHQIRRDRRVGRTPFVALILVPLLALYLMGMLRGYRFTPVVTAPLFGAGAMGCLMALNTPASLRAIVRHDDFLLSLALAGLVGLGVYLPAAALITRKVPSSFRWQALRFHVSAAALLYASVAPLVWGISGYALKAPLPSALVVFLPIPAGILGAGLLMTASGLWLLAALRPYRKPALEHYEESPA